jgi:hypothetical protein
MLELAWHSWSRTLNGHIRRLTFWPQRLPNQHLARYHPMTTPDYKSIALRLYGYGKFAEDYGYREEYWSQLRAIGAELGVADIENPEDLDIPWPPT